MRCKLRCNFCPSALLSLGPPCSNRGFRKQEQRDAVTGVAAAGPAGMRDSREHEPPPSQKRGGQERERQKVWQEFGEQRCPRGRRYANRSTSPLAHFWIDDDGKAQLQEAALPWKLSFSPPA